MNKVYISSRVNESLLSPGLSGHETKDAVEIIDSLRKGNLERSQIVFPDNSPGGGLRAINSDYLRILFRYDPELRTVMVADVLPLAPQDALAMTA